MTVVEVYRINKTDTFPNAYRLCRDQTWSVSLDQTFDSLSDAEDYVIKHNRMFCAVDLGIETCRDPEVARDRCVVNNDYLSQRMYFVGKPDIPKIKQQLLDKKVNIQNPTYIRK